MSIMPHTFTTTVDMVVLALHEAKIHVLLIQRAKQPFKNCWALPGGHVDEGEELLQATQRELEEETGLVIKHDIAQVGTFGHPQRDPRGHVITTAFVTTLDMLKEVRGLDDAKEARWFELSKLDGNLAFDHAYILMLALTKVHLVFQAHTGLCLELRPEVVEAENIHRAAAQMHRVVLA